MYAMLFKYLEINKFKSMTSSIQCAKYVIYFNLLHIQYHKEIIIENKYNTLVFSTIQCLKLDSYFPFDNRGDRRRGDCNSDAAADFEPGVMHDIRPLTSVSLMFS